MERIKDTMLSIEKAKQRNSELKAANNLLIEEAQGTKDTSKQMFNDLIKKFYNLKLQKPKRSQKHKKSEAKEQDSTQNKQGKVTFVLEPKQVL